MSDFFKSYRTKGVCDVFVESDLMKGEKELNNTNGDDDGSITKINVKNRKLNLNDTEPVVTRKNDEDIGVGVEKVKQKKKKIKKKKSASSDTTNVEDDEDVRASLSGTGSFPDKVQRVYKESTSIDSGIESDHCRGSGAPESLKDEAFMAFLHTHDDFLDGSTAPNTTYCAPKFSLNRVDSTLAFTLRVQKVIQDSIVCEALPAIGAARVKFLAAAAPRVQNYAFFVKLSSHTKSKTNNNNNNNNTSAIIVQASAESWDNNLVFQIDLDPRYDDDLVEYEAGLDQFHLQTYPMEAKIESAIFEDAIDDEGFSIEVENSSENEIKIEIKSKESQLKLHNESEQNMLTASDGAKRRNTTKKQKQRNRAYSESFCDALNVISESETLRLSIGTINARQVAIGNGAVPGRKSRSVSESYNNDDGATNNKTGEHIIPKYKGILKHSYDHSISMDSSVDDLFSTSYYEYQNTTDHELSESCKKSVRFSDHITRQLYKSNSSILGQRKKNQRKNDAKKRALQRKNSEGESADDSKENEESQQEENVFTPSGKRASKGNMIFDLEIDDDDDDE